MGICKWTVPFLPQGEKEYFLLPNSEQGYIVIRAVCTEGGYVPEVADQPPNPMKRMVLKFTLTAIQGYGYKSLSENIKHTIIKGTWKTRFGQYTAGVTKISKPEYSIPLLSFKRKYYVDTCVNDDIFFEFDFIDGKKRTTVVTSSYRIPDFLQNEQLDVNLATEPFGQICMHVKCKKSIYENCRSSDVPSHLDRMKGTTFPVEVIVNDMELTERFSVGDDETAPYVVLQYNGVHKQTGPCIRASDEAPDAFRDVVWDQSFFMVVTAGEKCRLLLECYEQESYMEFDDKIDQIGETTFKWPMELIDCGMEIILNSLHEFNTSFAMDVTYDGSTIDVIVPIG